MLMSENISGPGSKSKRRPVDFFLHFLFCLLQITEMVNHPQPSLDWLVSLNNKNMETLYSIPHLSLTRTGLPVRALRKGLGLCGATVAICWRFKIQSLNFKFLKLQVIESILIVQLKSSAASLFDPAAAKLAYPFFARNTWFTNVNCSQETF